MDKEENIPLQRGQVWQHNKNEKHYRVIEIFNEENPDDDDNNPPIVSYAEVGDFNEEPPKPYARQISKWYGSFTHVVG